MGLTVDLKTEIYIQCFLHGQDLLQLPYDMPFSTGAETVKAASGTSIVFTL